MVGIARFAIGGARDGGLVLVVLLLSRCVPTTKKEGEPGAIARGERGKGAARAERRGKRSGVVAKSRRGESRDLCRGGGGGGDTPKDPLHL